jgi:hypothetical protein
MRITKLERVVAAVKRLDTLMQGSMDTWFVAALPDRPAMLKLIDDTQAKLKLLQAEIERIERSRRDLS